MKISDTTLYNLYLSNHAAKNNKGSAGKDSERSKTYPAEWRFNGKFGHGIVFKSIDEVRKYVNKVTGSKTYEKLWLENEGWRRSPNTKVSVAAKLNHNGEGIAGRAHIRESKIVLDTVCGFNEYTVLHELAHCLGHNHHGRSFRRDLVKLVSRFMGKEAGKGLKKEFKAFKLAFGEPRKPLSFEKWVEAKNRMEKARAVS